MKTNEAPEKIYLDEDESWHLTNPNGDSVEYIRKDAFIEKAEKYLNDRLFNYIEYCKRGVGVSTEEFIEEFIKAQKGEEV